MGRVYASSFYFRDSDWQEAIAYLILRAELIVVTLTRASPGLLLELGTISVTERTDRTVVVVAERKDEYANRKIMDLPVLREFVRVISHVDVDSEWPMETFVFKDLDDRLMSILRTPPRKRRQLVHGDIEDRMTTIMRTPEPPFHLINDDFNRAFPISWDGIREGYEALAISCRNKGRSTMAARYFGSAARL